MRRRMTAVFLCLCLTVFSFAAMFTVRAETVATGTVNVKDGSVLYVRSSPSTSAAIVGKLSRDDVVTISETVTSGGTKWYHVTKDSITGYSSADYITLNATYESDADFEAYLTLQGFPETYKAGLREIHAQHPNWIFKAQMLSMTWATAIANESKMGKNLVGSSLGYEAWRSMEFGAYNWSTGKYVSYDSGGWYQATQEVLSYYMDPRNFLTVKAVFQFEELSYSADQTEAGVKAILPDKLDDLAADLLKAAKESGVSAYFLASKIVQEGTVSNGLALGTVSGYEGYYNFFDIGAAAGNGRTAVQNGALYAKEHGWNTPYKCLVDSANGIGKAYIKLGQNTPYYQKFNVVNTASGLYGHQYMTCIYAANSEATTLYSKAPKETLESPLTFIIPVYKEMPETVNPKPATVGNNNNFLDEITVSGCTLTPTFDRYTMEYAVQVGDNVAAVDVTVKPNSSGATVTGGGTVALTAGENPVTITVTSTSGAKRVYTVVITREGTPEAPPTITGLTYVITDTVKKVEPETTTEAFIAALAVQNGTAKVVGADGKEKAPAAPVATGDILQLHDSHALCASYPILIYGDVNGDGRITSFDLRTVQKHILGIAALDGYALAAADTGKDGSVTSLDLRITQKYILGVTATLQ